MQMNTKPGYNVLQSFVDKEGNRQLKRVGAMWNNTGRNGKPYYNLKIGELSLLVFENTDPDGAGTTTKEGSIEMDVEQ